MHRLTASAPQELRVDLEDFQMNTRYARYTTFTVGNATTDYRLIVYGYSGTAGDSGRGLSYHSGMKFSTKDRDNDLNGISCAIHWNSPWWYKSCFHVNFNGRYYHVKTTSYHAVIWERWHGYASLKKASMKIRRK